MGIRAWLRSRSRKPSLDAGSVPAQTLALDPEGVVSLQSQHVSLTGVKAGGDVTANITQLYYASSAEEKEVAEALIRGPLQVAGVDHQVERARELKLDGREVDAADLLVAAARSLEQGDYGVIAEFLLAEAAETFAAASEPGRAAELLEEVILQRLERFDSRAYFDARRLAQYLGESTAWRAEAFAALAIWPEHPDEAIGVLRDAWARSQGTEEELRWGASLVQILVTLRRFEDARQVADDIRSRHRLFAPSSVGHDPLSVELDCLDAIAGRDGLETVEREWLKLLAELAQHSQPLPPGEQAWVWQRRGAALARADRVDESRVAYVQAIKEWNRESGHEEQIKECFFSFDQVALLSGMWTGETQPIRVYASRIRGRRDSWVTTAERLERYGMQSRLGDGFPDALRFLWQAYGLCRVAGNLSEQRTAAELLAELLAVGGRREAALQFLVEAGKEKEATQLAEGMGDECLGQLRINGPIWERTVSFSVISKIGGRLSDEHTAELTPVLIEAAREPPVSHMWPQPASRACAALAALAPAVPDEHLSEVCDLLYEERQKWNGGEAIRALIVVTNLGRRDETERVARALFEPGAAFASPGGIVYWLGRRLADYPSLHPLVREKAVEGNAWALEALALAELAPEDEEVIKQIDAHVDAFLGQRSYQESTEDGKQVVSVSFTNNTGLGVTALFCSAPLRDRLIDRLLEIIGNDNEAEMSRSSAADALHNLAGAMSREQALRTLPLLTRIGRGEHSHSQFEQPEGATRDAFVRSWVRLELRQQLRASAITAASRISARAELARKELETQQVREMLDVAIASEVATAIAAALDGYAWLGQLELPVSFEEVVAHQDPQVRKAGIRSFASRDALPSFAELASLAEGDPDEDVRALYCVLAAEAGAIGRPVAEALRNDPNVFVRQRARQQLRSNNAS